MSYTIPNQFSTQSGNVPASQIDTNFTTCINAINGAFLSGTLAARPAPDGIGNGRYFFAVDVNGGTLYRDNGTSWVAVSFGSSLQAIALQGYLGGCTLSTAGSSSTMSISAGQATDSTNATLMTLAAINKTTGAWSVGTGNGGLDTGAIANSTWYHFFVIMRTDTSVVDVLFSLSSTAPTMPANYTLKRRIGSGKTDGVAKWTAFTQDGDYVRWSASVLDVNTTNPGTAAVSSTLTVPTGVNVQAMVNVALTSTTLNPVILLSDLAANDENPGASGAPLGTAKLVQGGAANPIMVPATIRTNTSAQIRYRLSASDANTTVQMATLGWWDYRGRFA